MSADSDLLKECKAAGVELFLDNGRLRYRAPPGAYTEELRQKVAAHKTELIGFLEEKTRAFLLSTELQGDHANNQQEPHHAEEPKSDAWTVTLTNGEQFTWQQHGSSIAREEAISRAKARFPGRVVIKAVPAFSAKVIQAAQPGGGTTRWDTAPEYQRQNAKAHPVHHGLSLAPPDNPVHAYYSHLLGPAMETYCCYPVTGKYCPEGARLKLAYERRLTTAEGRP